MRKKHLLGGADFSRERKEFKQSISENRQDQIHDRRALKDLGVTLGTFFKEINHRLEAI